MSDLRTLDANPIVTCRLCVWSVEYDRDALIRVRLAAGVTTDWETFRATARCEACGDPVTVRLRLFVTDRALRKGDLKHVLVFKALCVLEEAMHDAESGRVRASLGLRFALAYLYAVGSRSREWFDREPYAEFWQLATQSDIRIRGGQTMEGSARGTSMQTCVNAIGRAAGMEITPDVMARLGATVRRRPSRDDESNASNDP